MHSVKSFHLTLLVHLKGQSHEIKVWFSWAQWIGKILLIFPRKSFSSYYPCLILKLKSPSGTSFGLYFAYEEYRTDDSNSPAEQNVGPLASTDKMKTCSCGKDC